MHLPIYAHFELVIKSHKIVFCSPDSYFHEAAACAVQLRECEMFVLTFNDHYIMFNDIIYYLVMFHVATACTGASLFCFNFSYKVMVFMQQSFDNFEK